MNKCNCSTRSPSAPPSATWTPARSSSISSSTSATPSTSPPPCSPPPGSHVANGYSLFFDEFMSKIDARVWFSEVVPGLARLLLRLPALLEWQDGQCDQLAGRRCFGLRVLSSQDPGIVFLDQELIAALLACALFCLFPTRGRQLKHLSLINCDQLFVTSLRLPRTARSIKSSAFVSNSASSLCPFKVKL